MKKLLLAFTIAATGTAFGQVITNGNFEQWGTTSWEEPDSVFQTSNGDALGRGGSPNVTKTTDKQHGNFAIKLETTVSGSDTDFAYVLWGMFGDDGPVGGVPFTQKPDSIIGYYKCDQPAGDTAIGFVVAWQNDTARSMDVFTFVGTQSSYTRFAAALNISSATVDSITVAFASGNAFNDNAQKSPGAWLQIDNISFAGTGVTQNIPNPSFENWSNVSIESPTAWYDYNIQLATWFGAGGSPYVNKTTDAYKGTYACEITTWNQDSNIIANISNATEDDNGDPVGGMPFTSQVDTLFGWYKYFVNSGTDTGIVNLTFEKNDTAFSWNGTWLIPDTNWTYFEIPFNLAKAPDTVIIDIASASYNHINTTHGNVLIIDELQFKSNPVYTGVESRSKGLFASRLYPNPVNDFARIEYTLNDLDANVALEIYDVTGKQVFSKLYNGMSNQSNIIYLNTNGMAEGIYTYRLSTGSESVSVGRFVVE